MCLLFLRLEQRRSLSAFGPNSDNTASYCSKEKPNIPSQSLVPSINSKHCSISTLQCERCPLSKTTQQKKEEEEEAECKKKFSAAPIPSRVTQPLYQEMLELREKERKQVHEQRKEFLLSNQKPFSFEERDKNKMEKVKPIIKQVSEDPKNSVRVWKTSHTNMKDPGELKGGFSFSEESCCLQKHTVNQWGTGHQVQILSLSLCFVGGPIRQIIRPKGQL